MKRFASNSFWHGVAMGGLALLLGGLFWNAVSQPPPAYGQVPDSGAQRLHMIKEMKTTNQKLSEIAGLLKEIRDLTAENAKEKRESNDDPKRP